MGKSSQRPRPKPSTIALRHAVNRNSAGQQQRKSGGDRHGAQCNHERRNPQERDAGAVHEPDDGAASQAGENADQDDETGVAGERVFEGDHDQRAGNAGERDHRTLRQVEAADDEDQHLTGGDDDEIRRAAQHV